MKNRKHLVKNFTFSVGTILISACTNFIDPAKSELTRPTLSFGSGQGIISQSVTVEAGKEFVVNLKGRIGDQPLKRLTIQQIGFNIPLERLKINGVPVSSNSALFSGDDKTSFDYNIAIVAHSNISTQVYS